jgi:hypothetical protein
MEIYGMVLKAAWLLGLGPKPCSMLYGTPIGALPGEVMPNPVVVMVFLCCTAQLLFLYVLL